jgi:tape measure domain-containing protein
MSNTVDIIFAQEAIASIKKTKDELALVAAEILKISQNVTTLNNNFRNLHVPSDLTALNAANAQLTAQMQAQAAALAALQNQYNQLSQSRNRNNSQSVEEAVNQRLLNRNAREAATMTSALAGAYGRLNAEHQRASRNLQDLIVRGRLSTQTQREYNRELQNARRDFEQLDRRVRAADSAVGRFNRNVGNYPINAAKGIKELIQAFGITGGVAGVIALGKGLFETTKELMSLDGAMKLVTKTSDNFSNQQVFLKRISEAHGVEISALTKQFTQFYVSASDKISATEIQNIFESVAKSSAKMGLSVESQDRAFLALNQMMSKGSVTAEELRGQLGEALPGAFGIMARAMGVTEKQLGKMMKDGKVIASEVLPLFAKELEKTYGVENVKRVDNLSSAQTRFSNAWKNFVRSLDSDGNKLSKFFSKILNITSDLIKGVEVMSQSSEEKRLNILKGLRDKGYSETLEYYKNNKEATEEDMRLHRQYNIQKVDEFNKEKKLIIGRINMFKSVYGDRGFIKAIKGGEVEDNRAKAEAKNREDIERLQKINMLSKKYAGEVSALNQLLQEPPKVDNSEELSKDQEKALEERLKSIYEYNKAVLELEIAKNTALVNNEDSYYTDRLTALDKLLVSQSKLTKLSFDEEIRLAKENDLKKKTALEKFNKDAFLIREEYLKKQADLEKLDLNQITTFAKGKDSDPLKDLAESGKEATKELENTAEAVEKARKQLLELKKTTDEWLGSFSKDFLDSSGFGTLSDYLDGTFAKLIAGAETVEEKFAVTFNSIAETAQEAFNFISNASQANFDAEYSRLESQKENALKFAGEGTAARKKIEDDYEKKKKEVANRENKAKQKQAIFNIAIDTAQAVVASFIKDPTGITAAIIAALGAAQIGVVAAQKIPQYFDGGIHGGGLAMINDSGDSNYVETVVTPDGKMKQFKGRDVVVDLPKGTEIRTPEQQYQKELEHMINSRGVMLNNQVSQGMTEDQLDRVMSKHFSKIQVSKTVYDKKGFSSYVEYQGNKTIRNANRASGTGFNV